jgi:hypothetical protein
MMHACGESSADRAGFTCDETLFGSIFGIVEDIKCEILHL